MRLFIIAGEASGDLHGGHLIQQIKQIDPESEIYGWGGDRMEAAGMTLFKHYRDLAFMGFWEVVKNLGKIRQNFTLCKEQIRSYHPDAVIFIDYPGFNLRMVPWVKKLGIRTIYYISPQVWAWKAGRVKTIKKWVDQMITILPFEKAWYEKYDYPVQYVGHPLLDAIQHFKPDPSFRTEHGLDARPIIALLPGSREQEIRQHLPIFLQSLQGLKSHQFVVAAAPNISKEVYSDYLVKPGSIVYNKTYDLLHAADLAIVSSGTATLETALFGVPQIVGYKGSVISYWIAKRVVKVKYISLVNLILEQPVVPELIQKKLTPEHIKQKVNELIDPEGQTAQQEAIKELKSLLDEGGASALAAQLILNNKQ